MQRFQFKDISGQVIADPRPSIERNGYRKIDYQAFDATTKTAITELGGRRPTQEDRVIAEQITEFSFLSSAQCEQALDATVRALQARITEKKLAAGSTLCVTALCGTTLYNANVGDSESFLVVKDKNNVVISFKRINTKLHHINNDNVEELKQAGFQIISLPGAGHRLYSPSGNLNMYRAMGDLDCNGMQHHPDIYTVMMQVPEGGSAFVINACDGLTEQLSLQQLEKLIKDNSQKPLEDLPTILASAAIKSGSNDNVSVVVTPVEPSLNATPKYIGVFDGHGGSTISSYLANNFHGSLARECYKALLSLVPDDEKKASVQLKLETACDLTESIYFYTNVSEFYYEINKNFFITLSQEHEQAITQHWEHVSALMDAVKKALALTENLRLSLPSSPSSKFSAAADEAIKSIFTRVEAKVEAALLAFQQPPTKDRTVFLDKVIDDLKSTTQEAIDGVRVARKKALVASARDVLDNIPRLLKNKPQYQDILAKVSEVSASLDGDNVAVEDVVTQLLFSVYLETYKYARERKLFGNSIIREEIVAWLESKLTKRCPDIHTTVPRGGIKNTPTNRVLWYAGEKYGDLVNTTLSELEATKNKKIFVNIGKLLGRLGENGFATASRYFTGKDVRHVGQGEIEKHYDRHVDSAVKHKPGLK